MPSGSKKRKALKKPRPGEPALSPQGDVPELEPEFLSEDFIAKERKGTDEGFGAPAEAGILDSAEPIGETSRRAKEVPEVGKPYSPIPDHPKAHTSDPQEQTELQAPPFTAAEGEMVHTGCEMDGEAPTDSPQRDPSHFTVNKNDISYDGITSIGYFPRGEIQPGLEHDADTSDAPPIASEQVPDERRSEPFKRPCENELEHYESSARKVSTADLTSESTGPSIDAGSHRETFPDSGTIPGKIEQGVKGNTELPDTHSMGAGLGTEEKKFEPRGALTSNEPNLDSSPVKEKMTRKNMGQNTGDITPKSEALAAETKLDIGQDVSPTELEPGSDQIVLLSSLKGLSGNEPKFDEPSMTEEARAGMIQENTGPNIDTASPDDTSSDSGAPCGGIQPGVEADMESSDATPIDIKQVNERNESKPAESSVEEEFVIGMAQQVMGPGNVTTSLDSLDSGVDQMRDEDLAATRSVLDAALEEGQPEDMDTTDAQQREICIASDKIEQEAGPEMDVTASDMERGATPENSQLEIDEEPALGEKNTILASMESKAVDNADAETSVITDKNSSGTAIDPRVEETEAETKPEENTLLVGAQEDEVAEVFTEPELQERASQRTAPNMILRNLQSSLEAGPESGPGKLQDTCRDVNTGVGPKSEEMKGEKVDAGNKGSFEPSDVSCSEDDSNERAENSDDIGINPNKVITKHFESADGTDRVNEDLSEPFAVNGSNDRVDISISDLEPQGKMPLTGLEAGTEVPVLRSGVEVPLDMESRQEGSYETELGQQDGQDQQGDYQQAQQRDREIDSAVESPEVLANDAKGQISDAVPETEVGSSEMEPKVQGLSAIKLDKNSTFKFDSGQQVVLGAELNVQNGDQQAWQEERETDLIAEASGVPASEANQEQVLPAPATAAAGGDALAIADGGLPAENQEMLGENDETDVAGTYVSLNDKQGSFDDEQSVKLNENSAWQHSVGTDDTFVRKNGSAGATSRGIEPLEQEQDLKIEQPSANLVVDDTVAHAEETHAAEIKGSQTTSDEQELSKDPRIFGVQSEKVEEGVSTISPPKSESIKDEYEPNNRIAFEQERRLNSPSGTVGKDIEEEQAALSTVAEAGSSITDLDEMPYYQQFSTDFTNSEHDADTFESRESAETLAIDSSPPRSPFLNETGPTEQEADDECSDDRGNYRKKDCLKKEFEGKAAQDLEPTAAQEKVAPKSRVTREVPAEVDVFEEGYAPEKGSNMEAGGKEQHKAVPANLGDISKGNFDTVELKLSDLKAIHAVGVSVGEVPSKISDGGPIELTSGQGMNGREAFHEQEVSLPMEAHVHDVKQRALNEGNLEAKEDPTREETVQHRSNSLGCCGMFNLLLGKS